LTGEAVPVADGSAGLEASDPAAPGEPVGESEAPSPPSRRRLSRRTFAGIAGFTVATGGFFASGWFAHSAFDRRERPPRDRLVEKLLPPNGVTLEARWRDLPARLVAAGVIDLEKLRAALAADGGLTPAQLDQLQAGTDQPVHLDAQNANYVLDVLWALGLANRNPIITSGPIAQLGPDQAANYASTGGWTLGAHPGPVYLATMDLVSLTADQQGMAATVAAQVYRPCCNNPTVFPDCNHGMAALGLIELMAARGAPAVDIFAALKAISPFWFPDQYRQLALYFQHRGEEWDRVDPRLVMGNEHSSGTGFGQVSAWLQRNGIFGDGGGGGGSCTA
jgi:hypothetical protein